MARKIHRSIGHHYIVEASGCDPEIIKSVDKVQQILVKAAEIAEAQVWSISVNRFPPQGVSGVIVISESHISTHTWPEYGYAALDFYTCGNSGDPEKLLEESKTETKFFTTALLLGKKISCRTSEKNKKGTGYFLN